MDNQSELKLDKTNVLPDSRAKILRGCWWNAEWKCWMQPVYCHNCGKYSSDCVEGMRFMSYLCTPCFQKYGEITNVMFMPDEVVWEKMKQEQLEKYGRILTNEELIAIEASDASPLASLIKEGR